MKGLNDNMHDCLCSVKKDYYTVGSVIIIIDKKIDTDFLDFISTKLSI